MTDVFQGITDIQNILRGLMLRMDAQGRHLDELTNDIRCSMECKNKWNWYRSKRMKPCIWLRNSEAVKRKYYGSSVDFDYILYEFLSYIFLYFVLP